MIISLVVAHGEKREIGFKNKLLWHLSEDLKNFKKITMGQCMVMGRKTYDSIGRLLPGRETWILTHDQNLEIAGAKIFHTKEDILKAAKDKNIQELFIVGGEMIYKLFLPIANRIYLTQVNYKGEADAYFPELTKEWKVVGNPLKLVTNSDLEAQFSVLEKM